MFSNNRFFKNHDWLITIMAIILQLVGAVGIYSTIHNYQDTSYLYKQLVFVLIGLIAYFLLSLVDFEWLKQPGILALLYVPTLILLVYVKFFGEATRDVNRWIDLGFFNFQPSEYAKIIVILVTAAMFSISANIPNGSKKLLSNSNATFGRIKTSISGLENKYPLIAKYIINALVILPIILLTLVQPALGNAMILLFIWVSILLITYGNQRQLFTSILLTILFSTIILEIFQFTRDNYNIYINFLSSSVNYMVIIGAVIGIIVVILSLKPKITAVLFTLIISIPIIFGGYFAWNNVITVYQKDRVLIYIDGPESAPRGDGYQIIQSKIALGSGRINGQGYLQGTQVNNHILTQASTDFIYAALAQQFGFLGSVLILTLYVILIMRILYISKAANSRYGSFVSAGVAILILSHIFINIGMNLGKLPVTGIPLPLISYGGSSIFVIMISLGLVQSVGRSKRSIDIVDDLMLRSRSLTI